jgi:hypothetical protein
VVELVKAIVNCRDGLFVVASFGSFFVHDNALHIQGIRRLEVLLGYFYQSGNSRSSLLATYRGFRRNACHA